MVEPSPRGRLYELLLCALTLSSIRLSVSLGSSPFHFAHFDHEGDYKLRLWRVIRGVQHRETVFTQLGMRELKLEIGRRPQSHAVHEARSPSVSMVIFPAR